MFDPMRPSSLTPTPEMLCPHDSNALGSKAARASSSRPSRTGLSSTGLSRSPRALRSVLGLGATLFLLACGGSQKPASEAPAPEVTPAPQPTQEARPELTPVEAPAGTFLWGRVKNPADLTDSVLAATGLPLDWRGFLRSSVPELVEVSNLNVPVELAVAVHPNPRREPLGVLSWGVASQEIVLEQLEEQNVQAEEGPGGVHLFSVADVTCVVGPSLGVTSTRVVCGDDAQAIEVLGPYALRGMPGQELSDADLHIEVSAAPLQKAYGQQIASLKLFSSVLVRQIQIDNPRFDRAAADAVFGVVDELIALSKDVERARVQLWNKGGDYELSMSSRFPGNTSWSVQTLEALGAKQTALPQEFWALPANTSAAYFYQTPDAERLGPLWNVAKDALAGFLETQQGVTKASRDRIDRWLTDVAGVSGAWVGATGPMVTSQNGDRTDLRPAWQLSAVQQDSARHRKLLDDLVAILAAPDLRRAATHEGASWLPDLKKRGALKGRPNSAVYEWRLQEAWLKSLDPNDRENIEAAIDQLDHGFLAIVPDGERTWFTWAQTREDLGKSLELMERKDAARLAGMAGLQALQARPVVLAGFVKLESLLAQAAASIPGAESLRRWDQMSRALPHKGQAPVSFEMRVLEGEATEVQVVHRIPRQFVADLTAALTQGLAD